MYHDGLWCECEREYVDSKYECAEKKKRNTCEFYDRIESVAKEEKE